MKSHYDEKIKFTSFDGVDIENDRGGRVQQEDFKLALDLIRKDSWTDLARIALIGHSNGGHIVLRTAAEEKVKCAVAMSQVSDWSIFISGAKNYLPDYYDSIIKEFRGSPEENPLPYQERSCLHLADKIKIPVLLVVGEDDTTTPLHLTRLMHKALLASGNDKSEMAVFPGVGHFYEVYAFDGYKTNDVADRVKRWLEKNL